MAKKLSAGIALVRDGQGGPELLVVHPGGPFWRNKDEHAWSIPKGELDPDPVTGDLPAGAELDLVAEETANREFTEETGQPVPAGPVIPLEEFAVGSGKRLRAFLVRGDLDASAITGETSNTFEMEWPPRSGQVAEFPEVDGAAWVPLDRAAGKLHKGQAALVDLVRSALAATDPPPGQTGW